jgi:hypothetical protein
MNLTNKQIYKKLSFLIFLIALVMAITSLWDDSFIVDEIPHVGAGYSYITKGDMRLNPEHPPLAKDLAGLILSILPIKINKEVFLTPYWTTDTNGQWYFGRTLIYNYTSNVDLVTRSVKISMLLFFTLSAWLIYKWTREQYNELAGFIAILLFSFSPTILAHSRFVTTDIPALFGAILGIYFFIKYLEKQNLKRFWFAAATFGIAQLTKFSMVLLVPLFLLITIVWCIAYSYSFKNHIIQVFKSILLMAAGIIIIVWPVYTLHTINYPPEKQKNDTTINLSSYGNRLLADPVIWASDKQIIRPLAYYATGILMVNQRSIGGNTTFFLGEVRNYAWKHYFPVVYAIKEPLPFWFLTIIILLYLTTKTKFLILDFKFIKFRQWLQKYFVEFSMLLWLAIYWYLSINANLNIGVRHLLPTYGFVFILLAGQLSKIIENWKPKQSIKELVIEKNLTKIKLISILIVVLLAWYIYEAFAVYPYYLTYFNQIAGGPSGGYRYVVDSNLDWGQDLKRLAKWVDKNNINKIYLDYFGWADQTYYLKDKFVWIHSWTFKDSLDFLKQNPQGGYIAVSASFYMGSREKPETSYAWLDSYAPIAKIGNSIFIWYIK